ncbi:MAG: PilN domain-containing protein [Chloroflexota bacterium]
MARINLLPWREERRRERTRQFAVMLGVAAALAVLASLGGKLFMDNWLEYQQSRNSYLETQIAEMDRRIQEIEKLEETRSRLLARKEIIEELQRSRSEMVHLFDELARTIPDGVYLTSIAQSGSTLTLDGVAESSARVSAYMRNIEGSEWIHRPVLEVVETVEREGEGRVRQFTLQASLKPESEEETSEVFDEEGAGP